MWWNMFLLVLACVFVFAGACLYTGQVNIGLQRDVHIAVARNLCIAGGFACIVAFMLTVEGTPGLVMAAFILVIIVFLLWTGLLWRAARNEADKDEEG